MHLNHNQLQPQLLMWQQKTVRGLLDWNFANFHSTAQDKFMQQKRCHIPRHTHTHIHTHLGAHLTQFICHKLRVMFLISAAATAQACLAPPTATCHTAHHTSPLFTESKKKLTFTLKELKSHKATNCRKKDYTFLVGPSFGRRRFAAAAKWIWLAASNANNCEQATPTATPSHQLATAHTHTEKVLQNCFM